MEPQVQAEAPVKTEVAGAIPAAEVQPETVVEETAPVVAAVKKTRRAKTTPIVEAEPIVEADGDHGVLETFAGHAFFVKV